MQSDPRPVDHHTIDSLWCALQRRLSAPSAKGGAEAADILKAAVRDGWIAHMEIESYLLATDSSLAPMRLAQLLGAFGVTPHLTFSRPRSSQTEIYGIERVEVHDFAHLLIRLERTGFAIDPAPICDALRPALLKQRFLTEGQTTIFWYARERHRMAPLQITVEPHPEVSRLMRDEADDTLTTATGYRVELWRTHYDEADPIALRVTAPNWRRRRRPLAAAA